MTAAPFALASARAALLVVDLQNDFVRAGAPQEVPSAQATLAAIAALRQAAHRALMPVIFTRYTAGPGITHLSWFSPECGPPLCSCWPGVSRAYGDRPGTLAGHDVVDELTPVPDELVIDKYGYGAFHNTELEGVLRARDIRQLWVVGTVTQICVEETVREGFRRGFEIVVAADGVSSFDDRMHRETLRNLAHKFALVSDTATMLVELERADTP
ncbi:MAG: nicotinamidase-related amidase [Minisyncoccia bacterium]